ncbi:MAG: 4Fe-4S binding protein [Thermoguttaceae bacterium]
MMNRCKQKPLVRYRYAIMIVAALLFLPPLAFIFQLTGNERFCGTWCMKHFLVWHAGETWGAYVRGYGRAYMGVALLAAIVATTFFFGRHWCSHLCPVGGLMELGSRLVPRFLKIKYAGIPAPAFRYGYLSVYFLAPAFGVGALLCSYCNFGTVPRLVAAPFSGANAAYFMRTSGLISLGLIAALGFFAKGGRAYCNLLCPIGALDAISNFLGAKLGRRRVSVAPSSCHGCGKCAETCPVWAIGEKDGKAKIDQICCMPCRQCETACPTGAITYGKPRT